MMRRKSKTGEKTFLHKVGIFDGLNLACFPDDTNHSPRATYPSEIFQSPTCLYALFPSSAKDELQVPALVMVNIEFFFLMHIFFAILPP